MGREEESIGRGWRRGWVSAVVAMAALLSVPAAAQALPPNIVVVMSDDQAHHTVGEMPEVSGLAGLEPFGALYNNVALCCPARATFLTGLDSRHTGVERNTDAPNFDPSSTIATWLDDVGYETGLFGKYLNRYPWGRGTGLIPPGWDRWFAFLHPAPSYYDYTLSVDGDRRRRGDDSNDYSTDVLARKAEDFALTAPEPFFALVTPFGPHGPYVGAPRHLELYDGVRMPTRPNFGGAAQGAPAYYRELPPADPAKHRRVWRRQMEALRSVDELVGRVVTAADSRSRETVVLYLSDNGYSLGSHNLPKKRCGYEECGRVPGLIRAPGDPSGLLAGNVDLAPTLADLADAPHPPTDGRSLVPQMLGAPQADRALLLRNRSVGGGSPELPYWGLRTPRWKYLDHAASAGLPGEELFDLQADPYELHSLAGDPAHADVLAEMRARLAAARAAPPG